MLIRAKLCRAAPACKCMHGPRPVAGPYALIGGHRLEAKRRGLLAVVAPTLHTLLESGYRIAPALCSRILELAGEARR